MIFYVILTSRLITRHHRTLNEAYSSTESMSIRWVQVFNIILLVTSLGSGLAIGLGRENLVGNNILLTILSVGFSTMLFAMGVMANRQNAVILKKCDKTAEVVSGEEKAPPKLREDLISLFEKEKVYLIRDLTIWDVSEKLGTNRTYVSRIINQEFGLTFTVYVNNQRVNHAKEKMEATPSATIEEIAEMSGFGSVLSLYRAFSAREGISITEFRKGLKSR
ncbi:MAG: helix-turn-helix transcriptional regulator, partial [Bacteroidales bacterium]|nr:helix-turn-helix transcriptional regulator [Bacteroidales bacterium]